MVSKILLVYSRGLADRAKKHVEYLKTSCDPKTIINSLPKIVKVYNDKGEFRSEIDILAQKLDILKDHDELHVLWDGTDPDAAVIIGMGLALGKEVVSYYVAPIGIRKYLWEVRAKEIE